MVNSFLGKTGEAAWQFIKKDIEYKIISGQLQAGEKLPSVRTIAKDYGVSINTAQKSVEALMKDETIMIRRGIGYYVKPYTHIPLRNKHREMIQKAVTDALLYAGEIGIEPEEILSSYRKIAKH